MLIMRNHWGVEEFIESFYGDISWERSTWKAEEKMGGKL
jgi:hypothetical protein